MWSVFEWKKSELVFVITVVAAIVGVSMWQLRLGQMKTRDAQRKADVELVSRALSRYFEDYQLYPKAEEGKIVSCGNRGEDVCEWGGGKIVDGDNVTYLEKIPEDPLAAKGWNYVYETDEKRHNFKIYVGLEDLGDKSARPGLTRQCGSDVQCKWYVAN